MSTNMEEDLLQPTSLQEAINLIKFLQTTHKQDMSKLKEAYLKQTDAMKRMESMRKRELEFLSCELQKYEVNLEIRTEAVAKQLAEKDDVILKQAELIEELKKKLSIYEESNTNLPLINICNTVDSNSDSGVVLDNEEGSKTEEKKNEGKTVRKCSRRFAESISFLRRVDFSPMKYKPRNQQENKKKDEKKHSLELPITNKRLLHRQFSNDRPLSDDERSLSVDSAFSYGGGIESLSFVIRPKNVNDSMNNHFSDDGSEDTSEEIFDRVMTRNSIRRSVKANPKYKKINRTKSKLLDQVKVNIID